MRASAVAAAFLLPSPAFAEVCDKARPNWTPEFGRVGPFDDLFFTFTYPIILVILILTLIMIWFGYRLPMVLLIFIWSFLSFGIYYDTYIDPDEVTMSAIREGCLSPAILTPLVCLAIALALLRRIWQVTAKARAA